MGLLRNEFYWAGLLSAFDNVDRTFVSKDAREQFIASTGCGALADLVNDPDFDTDVEDLFELGTIELPKLAPRALERFLKIEREVFLESGATGVVVRRLLQMIERLNSEEVSSLSSAQFRSDLERLVSLLCSNKAASTGLDFVSPEMAPRSRWEITKRTVSSIFVMSANAGSATALSLSMPVAGVAAGLVAGYSVEFGRRMWMDAWRGRW
jgi:hypothetical protein